MSGRPDWTTTVRRHWRRTTGFLLASREPCLRIREQELAAVKGRALATRDPDQLLAWSPPESWVLGVVVCPGDTIDEVVEWMRQRPVDTGRVWFYLHADCALAVLRPWIDAGFSTDQVDRVDDRKRLHKPFGAALNDQVYADWHHLEA